MRALVAALAVLVAAGAVEAHAPADVNLPSGFYKHRKRVVKVQREILGQRWDPYLLAQIEQESTWRPRVGSPAGARGLTQFIPSTQRAIEQKYGIRGSIYNVEHAARLQALLMRDNLRRCGATFSGFHNIYFCALRIYNGSPAAFWSEWRYAGRPRLVRSMRGVCRRVRYSYCLENWKYPELIRSKRMKYLKLYPGYTQ